jgi:RimJ/RimL family protein N-acetyltransferase
MEFSPVTLAGRDVRLEPLDLAKHWDGLLAIGLAPELWRFTAAKVKTEADLRELLRESRRRAGARRVAAVRDRPARGSPLAGPGAWRARRASATSRAEHRRVEIGWTWLGLDHQRTALNTEAKYLMMRHAFEVEGCMRVEFKTSSTNLKSQTAMRRLGLVEEGTLRKWMFNDDGTPRDTMWFSCIDDEWPAMKARLEEMMARAGATK